MSAGYKIHDLPAISSLLNTDELEISRSPHSPGTSYRCTVQDFITYLLTMIVTGFASTTGPANTYAATITGITAYSQILNKTLVLQISNANTGPSTININSLGAIPMLKFGNVPLESGDFKTGQRVAGNFDGSHFQVLSVTDNIAEGN